MTGAKTKEDLLKKLKELGIDFMENQIRRKKLSVAEKRNANK